MEGVANGDVYLRDIYTKLRAEAQLQLSQFRLNNDSIGIVAITGKYDADDGKIGFKVNADNVNFVMDANGYYNLKDSTNSPLHTDMKLDHAKIGILNSFLYTLFDNYNRLCNR
jgi:hypothetical protein